MPLAVAAIDELRDAVLEALGMRKASKDGIRSTAYRLAAKTLRGNLATLYGIGPAAEIALKSKEDKRLNDSAVNNIVASTLTQVGAGIADIKQDVLDGDWDKKTLRAAEKVLVALNAMITGTPLGPALRGVKAGSRAIGLVPIKDDRTRRSKPKRPEKAKKLF